VHFCVYVRCFQELEDAWQPPLRAAAASNWIQE
jgi:hypothetical protein